MSVGEDGSRMNTIGQSTSGGIPSRISSHCQSSGDALPLVAYRMAAAIGKICESVNPSESESAIADATPSLKKIELYAEQPGIQPDCTTASDTRAATSPAIESTAAIAIDTLANANSWTPKASFQPTRDTTSDAGTSATAYAIE